jgi:hypothetical protein
MLLIGGDLFFGKLPSASGAVIPDNFRNAAACENSQTSTRHNKGNVVRLFIPCGEDGKPVEIGGANQCAENMNTTYSRNSKGEDEKIRQFVALRWNSPATMTASG